jgi:predicted TIM-barrel fold metal-dependent hydrolase
VITDVHAHVTLDVPAQLSRARQAGVERTVLMPTSVHPEAAQTREELRAEFARLSHVIGGAALPAEVFRSAIDEVLSAVRAHPGETIGFASVPLDAPATEIRRRVADNLAQEEIAGIGELTPRPDGARAVGPVLEAVADHGGAAPVPVFVHGFLPNTLGDLRTYHELAGRHPSVPLVVGAFGGLNALDLIDLAAQCPNLYIDLANALQTFAVRAAARTVPEQCLFGSNTPYGDVLAARDTVEFSVPDKAVRALILGENFERLLAR